MWLLQVLQISLTLWFSASPYLLFASLTGSSLSLVLILDTYGGCKEVPRAWKGGEWEESHSWTRFTLSDSACYIESFPSSWKMLVFTEDMIQERSYPEELTFPSVSRWKLCNSLYEFSFVQGKYSLHREDETKRELSKFYQNTMEQKLLKENYSL